MIRVQRFLIVALLVLWPSLGLARQAPEPSSRLLVVPFQNTLKEPRVQWLSEAAAVLLADGLRGRGVAALARSERVGAFERLHLPLSGELLSRATIIKVGELVGAGEVVTGSFRVEGTRLTVIAQGIRVDVGRRQPDIVERGELTELFTIFERLAGRLARNPAPTAAAPLSKAPLGAFESYIKGLLAESPTAQASFLESAIKEHPGFDRARLALWHVRTEQGDHAAALTIARTVPAGASLSARARFAAAISLVELKRFDEAFGAFKALLSDPALSDAWMRAAVLNNMGVLLVRRGATPETGSSVYHFTKATDAEPDPDYMFNLGYAYAVDRNYQGALYWLREVVRRDPTDADAHFVLAGALQATGSAVEAGRERELARQLSSSYESIDKGASAPRTTPPSGLERMRVEPEASRALRADLTIVTSAQREQRELAAFHLEQGRKLFDREQDREALAELRRAVYLSPYEAEAHLLAGRIHLRGGHPVEAIDAFKISIWSADRAPARALLAEAYLKTGDNAAARGEAERALAMDPGSEAAKAVLAAIK